MPFALIAAMIASLGLHAAALFVPEIELSPMSEPPPPPPIEAVLQPRRAPLVREAPKPPTRVPMAKAVARAPAARPAAPAVSPVAEDVPMAPPLAAPPSLSEPATTPAAPPPADLNSPELPESGRISYQVMSGDGTTLIGSAEQVWSMADGRYWISSVMETSGLAALLRPVRVETESTGRLTEQGLQPEMYQSRRVGRERVEQVRFDWAAGRVRFGNGSEAPLPAGAQDLLSFNYQLGWLAKTGDMTIATGRKLGTYRLDLIGKEWLETPAGPLWTLHFRAVGDTTTEVWLASEQHLLPVKIRHIDKKGERFEQIAREIRLTSP